MALEIERKFLVDAKKISALNLSGGEKIFQGYLSTDKNKTVRVRIKNNSAFLTVKTANIGIVRGEYEYKIPLADAEDLLQICEPFTLKKTRYKINFAEHTWEVDFFSGKHDGLILAEVELSKPDELVQLPDWILEEVSDNPKYYNSNLVVE